MTLALRDVNVSAQGAASFLVLPDLSFCFSLQHNERALFVIPQELLVNCKANSLSLSSSSSSSSGETTREERHTHSYFYGEIMIELHLRS